MPDLAEPMPPDPLEIAASQEWAAAQLAQQHVAEVINKITDAWRRDRAEIEMLRAKVVGLSMRIVELEAAVAPAAPEIEPAAEV